MSNQNVNASVSSASASINHYDNSSMHWTDEHHTHVHVPIGAFKIVASIVCFVVAVVAAIVALPGVLVVAAVIGAWRVFVYLREDRRQADAQRVELARASQPIVILVGTQAEAQRMIAQHNAKLLSAQQDVIAIPAKRQGSQAEVKCHE